MVATVMEQNNRIHPHKFALWIGIGSIVMMFAGLTSAYIIKRNQANWISFDIPPAFFWSTAVIILSSVAIHLALRSFKDRRIPKYRMWLAVTLTLGVVFVFLQILGFAELFKIGIAFTKNVAFSFLYVIVGFHALHVLGGIIALLIMLLKAYSRKERNYSSVPIELMATYWHFVDVLWIYLLVFLIMIR